MPIQPPSSHDLALLDAAYQIGKHIQSFVTEETGVYDKPWSYYSERFRDGPNPRHPTKEGLVLEMSYGQPQDIHTPFGALRILNGGRGDWEKVFDAIKEPLGLKLLRPLERRATGEFGPYWAITQWQDLKIPMPVYRTPSERIPYETVKAVWASFINGRIKEAPQPKMILTSRL